MNAAEASVRLVVPTGLRVTPLPPGVGLGEELWVRYRVRMEKERVGLSPGKVGNTTPHRKECGPPTRVRGEAILNANGIRDATRSYRQQITGSEENRSDYVCTQLPSFNIKNSIRYWKFSEL